MCTIMGSIQYGTERKLDFRNKTEVKDIIEDSEMEDGHDNQLIL